MKQLTTYLPLLFLLLLGACKNAKTGSAAQLTDDALMDTVQRRTFNYFWEGAEPNSGLAPERIHIDGIYPEKDQNVITSGGSGFGIMAILSGIDRNYITREEGLARMEKIVSFLEKADRFHGAYPHWWYGDTGKVKPFGQKDNGGDLVETAFLIQGLLAVHQYYVNGSPKNRHLPNASISFGVMSTGISIARAIRMYSTGIGVPNTVGQWTSPYMVTTNVSSCTCLPLPHPRTVFPPPSIMRDGHRTAPSSNPIK